MVTPLFLMGLPKTGTTLLQRILASHPAICSSSEPWALLPPLAALQPDGMVAEYGARSCHEALQRILATLPDGRAGYLRAVGAFGDSLYTDLADPAARYFLDKTPRYHLIAEDLLTAFPKARFLFLWRNPLSVIASTILHNGDRLEGLRFAEFDVVRGYPNLADAEATAGTRGLSLRYEDFVQAPEAELQRIMMHLELEVHPGQMSDFARTRFSGGDRNGIERRKIETASLERWRSVLNRPARRAFGLRLLRKVDDRVLRAHGYDPKALIDALRDLPVTWSTASVKEYVQLASASAYVRVQGQAIRSGKTDALLY